jgi:hypothetical protein
MNGHIRKCKCNTLPPSGIINSSVEPYSQRQQVQPNYKLFKRTALVVIQDRQQGA